MPSACLTSCLSPTESKKTVAELVSSKLSRGQVLGVYPKGISDVQVTKLPFPLKHESQKQITPLPQKNPNSAVGFPEVHESEDEAPAHPPSTLILLPSSFVKEACEQGRGRAHSLHRREWKSDDRESRRACSHTRTHTHAHTCSVSVSETSGGCVQR